jgi:hypothetical protein
VRREMLRLQMDAQRADLAAETVALKSDELTRRGIHISELAAEEPAADDLADGADEEPEAAAVAEGEGALEPEPEPEPDMEPEPEPEGRG